VLKGAQVLRRRLAFQIEFFENGVPGADTYGGINVLNGLFVFLPPGGVGRESEILCHIVPVERQFETDLIAGDADNLSLEIGIPCRTCC
jgi:hypothetical protein